MLACLADFACKFIKDKAYKYVLMVCSCILSWLFKAFKCSAEKLKYVTMYGAKDQTWSRLHKELGCEKCNLFMNAS